MKRKSTRKQLSDRADKAFRDYIKDRDQHCRACGESDRSRLQCAHVISRRYHAVRWDEENAMALCAKDHMRFTNRPLEWELFVLDEIGAEKYAELRRKALTYSKVDYAEVLAWLEGAA